MTLGLIIFGLTYLLIAIQRLPFVHLNRPAASLLGAVAMVVFGVLPLRDAYAAIDFDVLVFLLGLMLIVGYLEVGKFFEWAAEWLLRRARTPERLLLDAVVGGGLLSALFVNDTYAIDRVEWSLLLFFASLFVVMRGFEQTGAVAWLDDHALRLVQGGSPWRAAVAVSGVMTTLSNLISNVPAVILWRNTVPTVPNPDLVWRVLAMSSTFAGNLLLIGSMANLIVAERAQTRGVRIGFREYARIGVPVTLLTLAWGVVVLVMTS